MKYVDATIKVDTDVRLAWVDGTNRHGGYFDADNPEHVAAVLREMPPNFESDCANEREALRAELAALKTKHQGLKKLFDDTVAGRGAWANAARVERDAALAEAKTLTDWKMSAAEEITELRSDRDAARDEIERLKLELGTALAQVDHLRAGREAMYSPEMTIRIRNKLAARMDESTEDAAYRVAAERSVLREEVERLNKAAANVLSAERESLVRKCADAAALYVANPERAEVLRRAVLRAGGVEP